MRKGPLHMGKQNSPGSGTNRMRQVREWGASTRLGLYWAL